MPSPVPSAVEDPQGSTKGSPGHRLRPVVPPMDEHPSPEERGPGRTFSLLSLRVASGAARETRAFWSRCSFGHANFNYLSLVINHNGSLNEQIKTFSIKMNCKKLQLLSGRKALSGFSTRIRAVEAGSLLAVQTAALRSCKVSLSSLPPARGGTPGASLLN